MTNLDDTQPGRAVRYNEGVAAPPRVLLWGVIGLFLLGIIGTIAGVYVFREVLRPGQQQRVIGILPFMESFLPPRPGPGDTVPTVGPVDEEAAQNLLNMPLGLPGTDTPENAAPLTENMTIDPSVTPTELESTPEITPEVTDQEAVLEIAAQLTPDVTEEPPPSEVEAVPTEPAQAVPVPTLPPASERTWASNAFNTGFVWDQQDWNNCGPANITMALTYFGWTRDQGYAASYVRPTDEDKNVSPHELVRFVNEYSDVRALTRMGGDLDLLRTLVSNEFPVIIERSHMFGGYEWLGHYQTIVGYSDPQRVFFAYDTFLGTGENGNGVVETFTDLDHGWQAFNRTFIVVYHPAREQRLMDILDELANPIAAAEHAFEVAQSEARADPQNGFAWFNMGTSLTELARFEEASYAFDKAAQLGVPWRMLWYQFGPFEAFYETGRYQDVLSYVDSNLSNGGQYVEETYYWQGRALEALGDTQGAISAYRNAIRRNSFYTEAQEALAQLTA